jgi:hypothetical protein
VLVALLVLTAAQRAGQEGTISGTLRLNGVATAVTHVYASVAPGFFDKATEDVHVLFSDVALSDDERKDTFALARRARSGEARIVEIVIDAKGQPISGSLYAREFGGMISASGMHAFTRERLERTVVAGRLVVQPEGEFNGVRWSYDVTFTAPIPRPPTPAEIIVQLASPAARVVESHLGAIRAGQLAAVLARMTPDAAADFAGPTGAAAFAQMRADIPPDAKVVELIPQTDGSVLAKVEGHERGMLIGYTFRVALVGGEWKIAR